MKRRRKKRKKRPGFSSTVHLLLRRVKTGFRSRRKKRSNSFATDRTKMDCSKWCIIRKRCRRTTIGFFLAHRSSIVEMIRSVLLVLLYGSTSLAQYSDQSWLSASEYLVSSMNRSISECENFYKHVCGGFGRGRSEMANGGALQRSLVDDDNRVEDTGDGEEPGEKEPQSEIESKEHRIYEWLSKAIKDIDLSDDSSTTATSNDTDTYDRALRRLYDGCMQQSQQLFPDEVLRRLYTALGQRIGYPRVLGGSGGGAAWRVMGAITRQLGNALVVVPDVSDGPSLDVYPVSALEGTAYSPLTARSLLITLAKVTGAKLAKNDLDDAIQRMNAFHRDWDSITSIDRTPYTLENTLANLTDRGTTNLTRVDWREYLQGLLPSDIHDEWTRDPSRAAISIADNQLLNELADLLLRHDSDTIHTFAFIDSITSVLLDQSENGSEPLSVPSASDRRCVKFASDTAPSASARVLLQSLNIDPTVWRNDILLLAGQIKAAFKYLVSTVDWLDGEDKMKLSDRLDEIRVDPGLPDWIMDDEKVMVRTPRFDPARTLYENEFEFEREFWLAKSLQLIRGLHDDDPEPNFEVNSYYQAKMVHVNLGFALPPQFRVDYPLPLKYGGLGFVIAHQFFHAFDPNVVAEEEEIGTYFKPSSLKEYVRRRSCLIQQYSKYCNRKVARCVSGESSVNDNMGDVDGLKVAYAAYRFASQVLGGEPPVPQFVGRTGEQMFFVSFARIWCVRSSKATFLQSAGAEHAPPRVRVDLSLANFPAFAAAFHCTVGSRFAPLKRCSIWAESFAPAQVPQSEV